MTHLPGGGSHDKGSDECDKDKDEPDIRPYCEAISDRLIALTSEVERLRAALRPFLACFTEGPNGVVKVMPTDDDFRNAHAAAQEKP